MCRQDKGCSLCSGCLSHQHRRRIVPVPASHCSHRILSRPSHGHNSHMLGCRFDLRAASKGSPQLCPLEVLPRHCMLQQRSSSDMRTAASIQVARNSLSTHSDHCRADTCKYGRWGSTALFVRNNPCASHRLWALQRSPTKSSPLFLWSKCPVQALGISIAAVHQDFGDADRASMSIRTYDTSSAIHQGAHIETKS